MMHDQEPPSSEPIFKPGAFQALPVILLTLLMIAIQAWVHYGGWEVEAPILNDYAFFAVRFWRAEQLSGLLTYSLLHAGWAHLAINCVAFFALGTMCWRIMGTRNFLILFILTAVAGALAFALVRPGDQAPLVGVSGVVFGFVAAFKRLEFRQRAMMGQDVRREIAFFMLQMVALNLLIGFLTGWQIAWDAHLGGFFVGWLIAPTLVDSAPRPAA